jgi:hypothetical protein
MTAEVLENEREQCCKTLLSKKEQQAEREKYLILLLEKSFE